MVVPTFKVSRNERFIDHSSESSYTSGATTMTSLQYTTVGSMSPVGPGIEGEVSRQLLGLTLENSPAGSADSFSSEANTYHNKGAMEFLKLV